MRGIGLLLLIVLTGCGTAGVRYAGAGDEEEHEEEPSFLAARLTNLSDPACRRSLSAQVTSVLVKEGETRDAARTMATSLFEDLWYQVEPGPFYAVSPGGVRYGFFLEETEFGCVLHLYERHRMFGAPDFSSTDTLDYLASRTVLYCTCSVAVDPDAE